MPLFITFEGGEGSGKSTQIQRLAQALQKQGHAVLQTREPGGTEIGKMIRNILLDGAHSHLNALTELMLYAADRAQHVGELIHPALQEGKIVLCDRFIDATLAYQGYGRGLDLKLIAELNQLATEGMRPTLTFLLLCPVEVGLKRSKARLKKEKSSEDRFEKEALEFHKRVQRGYLELAELEPTRFRIIDATLDVESVHQKILQEFLKLNT
jgi:dTMP kinase